MEVQVFLAAPMILINKLNMVAKILEVTMLVLFGISWPFNLAKSIKSKSTKGKSLIFLILIDVGYIAGMLSKFFSTTFDWSSDWWIFMFYVINFIMVSADIVMYFINRNREKKGEGRIKDEIKDENNQ